MKNQITKLITALALFVGTWVSLMATIYLMALVFGAPFNYHTWHPLAIGIIGVTTFIGSIAYLSTETNI